MSMRDEIVQAAERVIRDLGLARCTTREIAEAAQCSEGTIYRHFRSKEDLFLAVLAERLPGLLPFLRTLPESVDGGEPEVRDTLQRVAEEALAFYRESMPMLFSVFAEPKLLGRHREYMQTHNVGPHRAAELLTDYLRAAQRAGVVSPAADPVAGAQLLLGACYLTAFGGTFTAEPDADADRRSAESFVAFLWQTLVPAGNR